MNKVLSLIGIMVILSCSGCGGKTEEVADTATESEVLTEDAMQETSPESEVIKLDMLRGEERTLVKELATIPQNVNLVGMLPDKPEDLPGNSCFVTNDKGAYYVSGFSEDMAQYRYGLHICHYDYNSKTHELLYSVKDANYISELRVTNTHLAWVEQIPKEGYKLVLHELSTGAVSDLGTYDQDICIEMSNRYIVWNDSDKIMIYDISKQACSTLEEKVIPQVRYKIVDNGITYFTEEDGERYVKRRDLESGEVFSYQLDKGQKIASCFSNQDYIGWFTEYSDGIIHILEINSAKCYKLNTESELNYFDVMLYDKLYINDHKSNCIYIYDFKTQTSCYQHFENAYIGAFYNADKERANVNVEFEDRDGMTIMEF